MSFIRVGLQIFGTASRKSLQKVTSVRSISQNFCRRQEVQEQQAEGNEIEGTESNIHSDSDRSKPIPVEIGIKYMKSDAYKETYGLEPIWKKYRRNYKGQFAPPKTRKTCVRQGFIATSNPCPICRDEYLVLDYRNTDLLYQFISPYNGEIIDWNKTGLCQRQHLNLLVAIHKARDFGTISFDVPFRQYDYSEWCNSEVAFSDSKENK
ncbi:28S ribosomal protein S18b, mitochondrial [Copidosoma floridanum]|uniref:28S ribosomal protein S18b, mitochondrial n=1 Tax=Copidosoma floridanum TaxID=29053 RepID=UPI0006C9BF7A|nr:28S ribosomal protein S18b, mitochondrial [Copidosoma floridanum]